MNNLAVLHHYRGEYEKAFQVFEDAINYAQRSGYVRAQALALSSLGDLLTDLHELERAEECFDQALVIASQLGDSFLVFYASVAKARIARLGDRIAVADALLKDIFAYIQQNSSSTDEAFFRMEYGCLLLFSNKFHAAVDELANAISLYEQDGRILEVCISKLWLVAARLATGELDPGSLHLAELLSTYKNLKEPTPLHVAAMGVQRWFEKSNQPQTSFSILQPFFTQADEFAKKIPLILKNLRRISKSAFISPPHISIQAFGSAQVFLNGKQIMLSDWQTRETRDLFFFFLGSKPLTKDEIAAIFWPDLSPERLKMRFKTSLYRLRHAVGQNTILFEGERYRFNHFVDYEYGLEIYKEFVEKARLEKNAAKSTLLLQAAVDIVTGPHLADIDTEWADWERTQFESQHHKNLLLLAELYLDVGQIDRVIKVCQTALESNNILEEAYRLMMCAHAKLGDTSAVARVYKACSKTLRIELGINPSRETEKLYQNLI
ncbi:MAG: BTAD domain-containing putative transcriptional regulator [Chloroflexi bacterium]|nr:BTAD domain-containing putative transcriptional regulator [Chloroflexota bacterium]